MGALAFFVVACGDKEFSSRDPGDGDGDGGNGDGDLGGASSGGNGDGDGDVGDGDGDTGGTGGTGDGDTGGSGGTPDPCDECGGATPACNASDECVECTSDAHCSGNTPACNDAEECVECTDNAHCTAAEAPLCDTASEQCAQCLEDTDCTEVAATVCDGGTCTGCTQDDDCAHLMDTPVCEVDSGTCVECHPSEDDRASDTDACGTGVCNPQTLQCDATLTQNTKNNCSPCIADAECAEGRNCIPLEYSGGSEPVALGGFCMQVFPGCTAPYEAGAINRVSLSGVPAADYCGLAEEFTTCAAIKDLEGGKLCSTPADCGTEHSEARCESVNGSADLKCTYSCTLSNQCIAGADCNGPDGNKYCGGP